MNSERIRDEESLSVAKSISMAMLEAMSSPPSRVVSVLDECQNDLLIKYPGDWEKSEIRRGIAEAKISILFEMNDAESEFLESWATMETVGYSSLEREASMLFYLMKFCLRTGCSYFDIDELMIRVRNIVRNIRISGDGSLASHFEVVYKKLIHDNISRYPGLSKCIDFFGDG